MGSRTLKMVLLVLTPLLVLVCGTTFALMLRQTEPLDNQFDAAIVSCAVAEAFENNTKSSIAVTNTGNIDAYLRLRLVSYWVDSDGNIVSKPSRIPEISSPANGWIKGTDNTYYYPDPVVPGGTTLSLLGGSIVLAEEDGYRQVVEVFADAIQSEPKRAVTESWRVTLSGDTITDVP